MSHMQRHGMGDCGPTCEGFGAPTPVAGDVIERAVRVLHADDCPDDECEGGDQGFYERLAEALAAAGLLAGPVTVTAERRGVTAVRALHVPVRGAGDDIDWCYSCEYAHPCPTTLALDDAGVPR